MRKITRLFNVIVTVWILGCVAVLLAYCLWSLDRGLDLTDESYYLTAAINPDAVILWVTVMHWFTSGLWRLSGGLAGFRGTGLAILAVSSVVLALGTIRAFQMSGIGVVARGFPILLIAACSLAGALLYHAFVPFTPSYNLLAVSGIYMALGLVCLAANIPRSWRFYCVQILSGTALGIAFLAKFSSGVIAWSIVCGTAVVLADSFRRRILGIGLITGGMAATIGVTVILHASFSEALAHFRLGALVYMLGANETLPVRLLRYFNETGNFLRLTLSSFLIPLVVFGIYVVRVRPRFWIALIGLATFSYVVVAGGYLLGGMDRYGQQTAPLMVAVILSMLVTARLWMQHVKAIYLIGVLALLPFCIAIGTYNALHTQILLSLAPWGVLVGLLAFGIPTLPGPRHVAMLAGALFITIVTSQVLTNGFRAPYRLHRPLPEQNEAVSMPPLGTFRVDRETRDSYIKLTQLADSCGVQQGQGFLGLYNIPGIALILQSVPLGFPLLQDRPSTEPILDQLAPGTLKSAVVAIDLDSGSYDPGMPKQLATFPTGYRLCGTVTLPYQKQKVELWISQDRR
jgi:hypothetical protein